MTPISWALSRVDAMRGHLFPWVPVCLGTGIGLYFILPGEPTAPHYAALLASAAVLLALAAWRQRGPGPFLTALALIACGVVLAGVRANLVAAPVLEYRFYGAVEGRIVIIDRSQSEAVRLTLDQVRLDGVAPRDTPVRVRVSLHGTQGYITPEPGLKVILTAHLSAPQGPVEPGGFDFQRMAWFRQIGAVGYTRIPVLAIAPAIEGRSGLGLHRLRMRISTWVHAHMEGEPGSFAAAITTGDRSGMGQETLQDLRDANLAHLLAISGLHMGLLTGFVFTALRYAMALIPWLALRAPVKKVAAVGAIAAGAFYLGLSGGNVATIRAFVMISVMFVAVLFDRRALTLRAVALAAIIILCLSPEALTEPGFQMSFAATTALVAVFGWLRNWPLWRAPGWLRPILAVLISSGVAGIAVAPFAAAHFNQVSYFGLIANLLSVPIMGTVIMPAAVVAALLAPLGLAHLALAVMRPAIAWILGVAQHVASMEGAVGYVPSPPSGVLALVAMGGLMLVLWQGRARLTGLALIATALGIWSQVVRPDLLISPTGRLAGVMTDTGRALTKPRGERFAAQSWLENDGDPVDQKTAFGRDGWTGQTGLLRTDLNGTSVTLLSGRGAQARTAEVCATTDYLILAAEHSGPPGPCTLLDQKALTIMGAVAIYAETGGLRIEKTADLAGLRLWNTASDAP